MKIETSKLQGAALDWAVAKCEGVSASAFYDEIGSRWYAEDKGVLLDYSTDWAQGGPIIDREEIGIRPPRKTVAPNGTLVGTKNDGWFATNYTEFEGEAMPGVSRFGPTALIAAMRCYVASKLGDTVEVPEGLIVKE